MNRTKAFDTEEALQAAIAVFWERGYEAASLPDLLAAMGIGRQSLYDTFGDKLSLYRQALEAYRQHGQAWLDSHLHESIEPLTGIRNLLLAVAERDAQSCRRGCMLVNAPSGPERDPEITRLVHRHAAALGRAFRDSVARGQANGTIPASLDAASTAQFLLVTFFGLITTARLGLDRSGRRQAVEVAMRVLSS